MLGWHLAIHRKTDENRQKHRKTWENIAKQEKTGKNMGKHCLRADVSCFLCCTWNVGPHATKEIGDVCTQARENMANKGGNREKHGEKREKQG